MSNNTKPQDSIHNDGPFPLDAAIDEIRNLPELKNPHSTDKNAPYNYKQFIKRLDSRPSFEDFLKEYTYQTQWKNEQKAVRRIPIELLLFFTQYLQITLVPHNRIPDSALKRELAKNLINKIPPASDNEPDTNAYLRKILFNNEEFQKLITSSLWEEEVQPRLTALQNLYEQASPNVKMEGLSGIIHSLDELIGWYAVSNAVPSPPQKHLEIIQENQHFPDDVPRAVMSLEGARIEYPSEGTEKHSYTVQAFDTPQLHHPMDDTKVLSLQKALEECQYTRKAPYKALQEILRKHYLSSLGQELSEPEIYKHFLSLQEYLAPCKKTHNESEIRSIVTQKLQSPFRNIWGGTYTFDHISQNTETSNSIEQLIEKMAINYAKHFVQTRSSVIGELPSASDVGTAQLFQSTRLTQLLYEESPQLFNAAPKSLDPSTDQDALNTFFLLLDLHPSMKELFPYRSSSTVSQVMSDLYGSIIKAFKGLSLPLPIPLSPSTLTEEWTSTYRNISNLLEDSRTSHFTIAFRTLGPLMKKALFLLDLYYAYASGIKELIDVFFMFYEASHAAEQN